MIPFIMYKKYLQKAVSPTAPIPTPTEIEKTTFCKLDSVECTSLIFTKQKFRLQSPIIFVFFLLKFNFAAS